jgi:hypothetical protein
MALRTPLFGRGPQGGFYDFADVQRHPGDIWFVGSAVAASSDALGFGLNPDSPFATLDYAIDYGTDSAGDVFVLLPGHAEVVTEAGGLTMDCIGATVFGVGHGTLQPTITLTTADTATIAITAASTTFENVNFVAGFEDIATAILLSATDAKFKNCRFTTTGADHNALIWIQDAAAAASDRITVEDCLCIDALTTDNTHFINYAGTGREHVFRRNHLVGDWGTMAIGGAGVIIHPIITDNYVYNLATDADAGINIEATVTGLCVNNRVSTGHASASSVTGAALVMCENYGGLISDANGVLEPIAT